MCNCLAVTEYHNNILSFCLYIENISNIPLQSETLKHLTVIWKLLSCYFNYKQAQFWVYHINIHANILFELLIKFLTFPLGHLFYHILKVHYVVWGNTF